MDSEGTGKLMDKIGQKIGAATSGGTLLTGVSTYLEFLPALMGVIASGVSVILAMVVIYCTISKGVLERRLLRDQIGVIEGAPPKRGKKKR